MTGYELTVGLGNLCNDVCHFGIQGVQPGLKVSLACAVTSRFRSCSRSGGECVQRYFSSLAGQPEVRVGCANRLVGIAGGDPSPAPTCRTVI